MTSRSRVLSESTPIVGAVSILFFFNDTATTEIYTLSLHDALPIFIGEGNHFPTCRENPGVFGARQDRKSTRLNSSHANISYAVFCLKKQYNKSLRISDRMPAARTTRATRVLRAA